VNEPRPMVVRVSAKRWPDLPDFIEADSIGFGTPVPLPDGLSGMVVGLGPATKAAAGPDELRAFIEFAVQTVGPVAHDVSVAALSAWVVERLHHRKSAASPRVAVQTVVRVTINGTEVDASDPAAVEAAIAQNLNDADVTQYDFRFPHAIEATPQVEAPEPLSHEEWVEQQLELARRHREEVAELLRQANENVEPDDPVKDQGRDA